MNRKYKKIIYIVVVVSIIAGISYSVYAFALSPSPEEFVKDYLVIRYKDTDYNNIEEKTKLQKSFLENDLINSNFSFGRFNNQIISFKNNKFIIEDLEINVYNVEKSKEINVFTKIYFNVKSDIHKEWYQLSYYNLKITLKKRAYKNYLIRNVTILDSKYELPDKLEKHEHNDQCSHHNHVKP